jgi:hypothetical protein
MTTDTRMKFLTWITNFFVTPVSFGFSSIQVDPANGMERCGHLFPSEDHKRAMDEIARRDFLIAEKPEMPRLLSVGRSQLVQQRGP